MAIYGNFNGTLKNEVQIGKQGSVIQRSETNDSLTLLDNAKASKVDLNAKGGSFSGTSGMALTTGTTAERPASPVDGMIRFNTDTNYVESYSNNLWLDLSFDNAPYDISLFISENEDNADVILCGYIASRNVTIPSSCGNSVAIANTAPAGTTVYDVKINDLSVGNITFNASATVGTVSINTTDMVPNDILEIINPSTPDTTIADISVTIVGEMTRTCLSVPPLPAPTVWGDLPEFLSPSFATSGLALDYGTNDTWVVGKVNGYAAITRDNGVNWADLPRNLNSGNHNNASFIEILSDRDQVWMSSAGSNYVSISVDDNVTWSPVADAYSREISATYIGTDRNGVWIVGGSNFGRNSRLEYDGVTQTWTVGTRGYGIPGYDFSSVSGIDADGTGVWVIVFSDSRAIRSTNHGVDWSEINLNDRTDNPYSLRTDRNGIWICGYEDGVILRSIDNGINWSEISLYPAATGSVKSIATDETGNWVATMVNNPALSTDHGVTWTELTGVGFGINDTSPAVATNNKGV